MIKIPRTTYKPQNTVAPRSPRFHNIADTFVGLVLKPPVSRQKTKFGTNDPDFWDEEKTRPRMEHIYEFLLISETAHPEHCYFCKKLKPREDVDTGARRLYASDKMHWEIQKAMGAVEKPELYGPLVLRYEADDTAKKKPGFEAPKIYRAAYRNPTDDEVNRVDEFLGIEESQEFSTASLEQDLRDLVESSEPPKESGRKMSFDDLKNLSTEEN